MPTIRPSAHPPAPFSIRQFRQGRLVRWEHREEVAKGTNLQITTALVYGAEYIPSPSPPACATCKASCLTGYRSVYFRWAESSLIENVAPMCSACWVYLERETRDK